MASKVYYHLGSYDDSLLYALGAGDRFDVAERSEYVETMIAKCVDSYTAKRADPDLAKEIDPRQEAIVDKMFARCFADGEYKQVCLCSLK